MKTLLLSKLEESLAKHCGYTNTSNPLVSTVTYPTAVISD